MYIVESALAKGGDGVNIRSANMILFTCLITANYATGSGASLARVELITGDS